MKIAIPSYQRVEVLKTKSFKLLLENGVDVQDIYLFVADEQQRVAYADAIPSLVHIIVAQKGICNVRNFMTDYFEEGEIIIYMDDDIAGFKIKGDKSFLAALHECCTYLEASPYQLIGLPPTYNDYFNRNTGFKTGLFVIVGCFIIVKNDRSIRVTEPIVEDLQRTCVSYSKYGAVVRYHDLMIKTKPFATGGLNAAHTRDYVHYYAALTKLYYLYPSLLHLVLKKVPNLHKDPIPHVRFKLFSGPTRILQFPVIDKAVFAPLYELLQKTTLSLKQDGRPDTTHKSSYRHNFPAHRSDVFGRIQNRPVWGGGTAISQVSGRRPDLYAELKRLGDILVPFPWSSVLVNNNTVCGKHYDANNVGLSLLISIGEYEGCNIVIENQSFSSKYRPTIFNGSEMEHWNSDDLVGNKYSLVYYFIPEVEPVQKCTDVPKIDSECTQSVRNNN